MAFGFLLPPWIDFCETCKKVYPAGTGYNEYFCSKECEEKKLNKIVNGGMQNKISIVCQKEGNRKLNHTFYGKGGVISENS